MLDKSEFWRRTTISVGVSAAILALAHSGVGQNPVNAQSSDVESRIATLQKELAESRRQQGLLRQDLTQLQKMSQEFSAELEMLGKDVLILTEEQVKLKSRVQKLEKRRR